MNDFVLHSPQPGRRRLIGLICAAVVMTGLLTLAWWTLGGIKPRDDFSTFLPQPGGLAKGSPVTLQGLVVGRVREVRLTERTGQLGVAVAFWVDREHTGWLRTGTHASAVGDLVGATRLDLRPHLAGTGLISPGSELPGDLAPDLVTQMLELQPAVTKLVQEIDTLAAALLARTQQFDPILTGINEQVITLGATQTQVQALLGDMQKLLATVAADETALRASFEQTLNSVNHDLLPRLGQTLDQNNQRLGALFESLQRTTATVEDRLPRLLALSEETMRNSRDVSEAAANTWPFNRYLKKKGTTEANLPITSAK